MVEPGFAHGGDDDPIALEIDRVAVALLHGGEAATSVRTIERIAGVFAFKGDDDIPFFLTKSAKHSIRKLPIHLHEFFPRHGVVIATADGSGVAEQSAEDIGEKIREEFRFLELVCIAGVDAICPQI